MLNFPTKPSSLDHPSPILTDLKQSIETPINLGSGVGCPSMRDVNGHFLSIQFHCGLSQLCWYWLTDPTHESELSKRFVEQTKFPSTRLVYYPNASDPSPPSGLRRRLHFRKCHFVPIGFRVSNCFISERGEKGTNFKCTEETLKYFRYIFGILELPKWLVQPRNKKSQYFISLMITKLPTEFVCLHHTTSAGACSFVPNNCPFALGHVKARKIDIRTGVQWRTLWRLMGHYADFGEW